MGIDKTKHRDYHYTGIYRGTVTYNDDPDVKGKVKIFVHGVYPDEYEAKPQYLPWAMPAMGLFGGNWTNENEDSHGNHLNSQVGWCTVPHMGNSPDTGSEVYLFFEHGDINYPVYFAAVQAGPGWFSEHPNQHVFRSDNVHIRIDQNTADPRSTTKFDSYNQKNNLPSIKDGTKKQTQTRIDIQIQAKQMVAVNLQISGDINMRQIGDMYIQQEGNRHQTLIGNRYVKHIGNTYIEHDGIYISRQKGQYNQQYVEAQKITDVIGNVTEKIYGNEYKEIQGDVTHKVGYTYSLFTGAHCNLQVTENMTTNVMKDYVLNIIGGADVDVAKNVTVDVGRMDQTQTGHLQITTSNDTQILSKQGNISLETLGQFDLINDTGAITADGYKNLGIKGNIVLKSKMGNIGLETVGDKRFEKENMVIPWNPVFLNNLQLISMIIKDFDPTKIFFNNNILNITDIGSLMNFIMQLPMTAVYDGLPSFYPVKMIAQNPNHDPVPEETWRLGKGATEALNFIKDHNIDKINKMLRTEYEKISQLTVKDIERIKNELMTPEYKHFSNVEDNWEDITNTAYWKIIGKVVGNIDIRSWSGDINIVTEGRLGNAGNINIEANDPIGTLPDYTGGNVNISSHAVKTVYTDPRNMFLDSQNILNRTNILTNGDTRISKVGKLLGFINVLHQSGTAGGCASCLADAILSVVAPILPLPKIGLDLYALNIPLHEFNATIKPNDFYDETKDIKLFENPLTGEKKWKTGLFNMGFGHARDNGMINDFCTQNHGTINVNSDGSLHISSQNNYTLNTNKMFGDAYHFETTVTPNWKYGGILTIIPTYMPFDRNGVNLGNTLKIKESFGKYNYTFTHKKTKKVIGGLLTMKDMDNTVTDADVINYSITIGNKNMTVSEKYNDNWSYSPIPYLDPNESSKDPFKAAVIMPSLSYTEKYTNKNSYKGDVSTTYKQTINKNMILPITIINNVNESKNKYYSLNIKEKQAGEGNTVSHTVNKDIGMSEISNITTNTQGMNITETTTALKNVSRTTQGMKVTESTSAMMISQNFEAALTDTETHKALIMTQQNYESLVYNLDVKAASEKQSYVGVRSIESDLVSWAVGHLNFTQK